MFEALGTLWYYQERRVLRIKILRLNRRIRNVSYTKI